MAHLGKLLICHYGWDKGAKTVKIISVAIYSRSNLRLTGHYNSPHHPAPTCRAGPQSPVSRHSLPHSGERASECNEAPGTTSGESW